MSDPHRIVIVGGGFAGLNAARALRRAPVQVTLIDRRNFHLFQPLLYQVATGGLSPANIAAPLRSILRRQKNVEILLGEVIDIDPAQRRVMLRDGEVPFDTLIAAAGARHSYFGHDEWERFAPGLKTIEDATSIRRKILMAFEAAERETDPAARRALMTFVIVGAGPTGVEMAGALAEIARYTMKHEFRRIDPSEATFLLVDVADNVLPVYTPKLREKAARSLERLGVTIRTRTKVVDIQAGQITLQRVAAAGEMAAANSPTLETIATHTVHWAAGVQASSLAGVIAERTGAHQERNGKIAVEPDLSVKNHPEIFVLGDMAQLAGADGKPLPGMAPVAIQQGKYAAQLILQRLKGGKLPPFCYRDYGTMATIGRSAAVAMIFGMQLSGFIAWVIWLFVHLMQLVQFQNRLLVFLQWAWSYFTFNRSARLITGEDRSRSDDATALPS